MAPSQPLKCSGRWGGMAFHTARAQSLKHSSTSRLSLSSRRAMAAHQAPYFSFVSATARSSRAR